MRNQSRFSFSLVLLLLSLAQLFIRYAVFFTVANTLNAENVQQFRSPNGELTSHSPLYFRPQDFNIDNTVEDTLNADDGEHSITIDKLCNFLSKAERKVEYREKGDCKQKGLVRAKGNSVLEETPETPMIVEEEVK